MQPSRTVATVSLAIALLTTSVAAQIPIPEPSFSCRPRMIMDWVNGAIPACTDTLVLPTDAPPTRAITGKHNQAARLFRLGWQNGEHVRVEEYECQVLAEPPVQHVSLVLPHRLRVRENDGTPSMYVVELYCGYWFGDGDTTSIHFTIVDRYRAVAEARSISDSQLLRSELLVAPTTIPPSGQSLSQPLLLAAIDGYQGMVFDHWTSSHSGIAFDLYGREQLISVGCWPSSDTVRFTAWFRYGGTSVATDELIGTNGCVEYYDLLGRSVDPSRVFFLGIVTPKGGSHTTRKYIITN